MNANLNVTYKMKSSITSTTFSTSTAILLLAAAPLRTYAAGGSLSHELFTTADCSGPASPAASYTMTEGECLDCSSTNFAHAGTCQTLRAQYQALAGTPAPSTATGAKVTSVVCAHGTAMGYVAVQWYSDTACTSPQGAASAITDQQKSSIEFLAQNTPAPAPCTAVGSFSTKTVCIASGSNTNTIIQPVFQ